MATTATEALRRARVALSSPIDTAALVAFRVAFGLAMVVTTVRFVARGWVHEHFAAPTFYFKYWGFEWVRPWPGPWMTVHYLVMALAAVGIAAGAWYRLSCAAFFALFTYAHLIDKANYLNHYYLVSLLAALLAFMPLGRAGSIDAWRDPTRHSDTFPGWAMWLLRFQIGVVYFFGGVAKLSWDWLVHAQPMGIWLAANADIPLVGPLLLQRGVAHLASWMGAAFDLSIVFLLLWSRTRTVAFATAVLFHLLTGRLFHIGMFPWIMTLGATTFLSPSWPRRVLPAKWLPARPPAAVSPPATDMAYGGALGLRAMAVWVAVQLVLPLRHHLYPGQVTWTEQGFRFSWKVMLVDKSGVVDFVATEPSTGRRWVIDGADYLTRYQAQMMATQPDMILQLARHVGGELERAGARDVEVRADAYVSWNGRRSARLVDPSVDLAHEEDGLGPKRWILPAADEPPR